MDRLPTPQIPPPANLPRRMTNSEISQPVVLSRNASDPSIRVSLEACRGSVVAQLEGVVNPDVSIQWFRNNELIPGETSATIHFAELDFDDSDLYFATISTRQAVERSQSLVLAVVPGQPLLNFSARSFVSPQTPMVAGFVIGAGNRATQPKTYLVRAIGSSLKRFGIANGLTKTAVQVARRGSGGAEPLVLSSTANDPRIRKLAQKVGAFALEKDAPDFVTAAKLGPGVYTVIVSAEGDGSGEVLVEVYETSE